MILLWLVLLISCRFSCCLFGCDVANAGAVALYFVLKFVVNSVVGSLIDVAADPVVVVVVFC